MFIPLNNVTSVYHLIVNLEIILKSESFIPYIEEHKDAVTISRMELFGIIAEK